MSGAGLAQLVQEIKLASANIKFADDENRQHIRAIEESINDLYRKVGRPGGYATDDNETEVQKSAIGLCQIHRSLTIEGDATAADYTPVVAAGWACESSCFHNNPQPDLNEGLGSF